MDRHIDVNIQLFSIYTKLSKTMTFEKLSSFYCCIRRSFHSRYFYRFYHSRATRTWFVCNEMYHDVFRYEYLTFQTQIHLHKQYIFDTNILQSEYAFLFPFSIHFSGIILRDTSFQYILGKIAIATPDILEGARL